MNYSIFKSDYYCWLRFPLFIIAFIIFYNHPAVQAQSLRKLERRAINRTHLTFVNGDTVQRFTVTYARPAARPDRFYYWQGPTQILRTAGAYNGRLLTGPYQLTSRNGNLLVSGSFHNGLKTGYWRTWRPDGTPITAGYWQRGRQRGKDKKYDETGQRIKPVKAKKAPKPGKEKAATPVPVQQARFWQATYWKSRYKQLTQKLAARKERRKQLKSRTATPGAEPVTQPLPVPVPAPSSAPRP